MEEAAREFFLVFWIIVAGIGVAGAWFYGSKLYGDWKERRRVRKIMR